MTSSTSEPEAGVAAWDRTLRELDKALDEPGDLRSGFVLCWRLAVAEDVGVEVSPWVQKLGKRGQPGTAKRLSRRHLMIEYGARLGPLDARVAELLPERDGLAGRALLEALIDHPRVAFEADAARTVRVDRAPVGLVAESRHGAVRVSAAIDGTPLPPALRDRLHRVRAGEPLFLWDGARLTLLDLSADMKAILGVLQRGESVFPVEAQPALLRTLASWAQRVPIAMPRSVLGEAVPSEIFPVLRVAAEADGSVEIALRVRPLADSASHAPGEGPRDVHVRREGRAFHAVRDLPAEIAAASGWATELGLAAAADEERSFHYRCGTLTLALALLSRCASRTPPPVVEWLSAPLRSLGARGPRALSVKLARRHEWFGALGGLSVGGEVVALSRLLDAARRNERHVLVAGGSYVELTEALLDQLARLSDHVREAGSGLLIGPSSADVLRELEAEGATVEADAPFRALLLRVEAARGLTADVPSTLSARLRPYQVQGFRWLCRLAAAGAGGLLCDDMGLGKTVQILAFFLARSALGPALVVAPTSVAFNWRDEAARFAPSLRVTLYAEAADRPAAIEALGPGDVLVMSYGMLVQDAALVTSTRFSTLVFDEAQVVKNAGTQRHRVARALCADVKIALSGTPIENHLGELFCLFLLVFPDLLGSWASFRRRFAAPIERGTDPSAAPALARVVAPFLLRRTKPNVASELPSRSEVRVPVLLSTAEWQLYEDARLAALSDLGSKKAKRTEGERRIHVLAALTRLRLLACHPQLGDPRSTLPSSKLLRLLELVDELVAAGQRSLVFSHLTSHLAFVREALAVRGLPFLYLDGQTPERERRSLVAAFQEGQTPLFLISAKAGGLGLNLTAASNVFHLDPWWNPAVEDQASDRAHRVGQTQPVTIYRLVSVGTIEERMLALHDRKRALVARVLDGAAGLPKLTTDELVALLADR